MQCGLRRDSRKEDVHKMERAGGREGEGRELREQLDCVFAPSCSKFEAQIHNGERVRAWDHCSFSVAV